MFKAQCQYQSIKAFAWIDSAEIIEFHIMYYFIVLLLDWYWFLEVWVHENNVTIVTWSTGNESDDGNIDFELQVHIRGSVANAVVYPLNWATLNSPAAGQKTVGQVA